MNQLLHDVPSFPFRVPSGAAGHCRIRVYEDPGNAPLVIASELADNPGPSVTSAAEYIAGQVYRWLECPPQGIYWIEHWGPFSYHDVGFPMGCKEEYSLVDFSQRGATFCNPIWHHLSAEDMAYMLPELAGGPKD